MSVEAVIADVSRFWDHSAYRGFTEKLNPGPRAWLSARAVPATMATNAGRKMMLRLLAGRLARYQSVPALGDVLVYAPTRNNARALAPLIGMLGEMGLVRRSILPPAATPGPMSGCDRAAQLLAPWRHADSFLSGQLLLAIASYLHFLRILSRHPARTILLANDHSPVPVGLRHAALDLGRRVIYRQHAPVSANYPSLDCDLAVLADDASAAIYQQIGMARSVETTILPLVPISGRPIRHPQRLGTWLVLLSRVWDRPGILQALKAILSHPNLEKLHLRPHPADHRNPLTELKITDPRLHLSPPMLPLHQIADGMDLAIAAGTGAVIETLSSGLPTFYCHGLDSLAADPHGLVASGILPEIPAADLSRLTARATHVFSPEWQLRFRNFDPASGKDDDLSMIKTYIALRRMLGFETGTVEAGEDCPAQTAFSLAHRNPAIESEVSSWLAGAVWAGFDLPHRSAGTELSGSEMENT